MSGRQSAGAVGRVLRESFGHLFIFLTFSTFFLKCHRWSSWARSVWGNVGSEQNRQRIQETTATGVLAEKSMFGWALLIFFKIFFSEANYFQPYKDLKTFMFMWTPAEITTTSLTEGPRGPGRPIALGHLQAKSTSPCIPGSTRRSLEACPILRLVSLNLSIFRRLYCS